MKIITEQITIYVCYACRQKCMVANRWIQAMRNLRALVRAHTRVNANVNVNGNRFATQICPIDFHQKLVLYCPCQLKLIIFIWISTNFWHILLHINICTNDAHSRESACCHNSATVIALVVAVAAPVLFPCSEIVSSTAMPTEVI